jgi:hypothetical protein
MTQHEVPSSVLPAENSSKSGHSRPGLALSFNLIGGLIYLFGLVAPLTPSHGRPSVWVVLTFVGGPVALIWSASRAIRSTAVKVFLYGEILLIVGFSCYLLFFLERGLR